MHWQMHSITIRFADKHQKIFYALNGCAFDEKLMIRTTDERTVSVL